MTDPIIGRANLNDFLSRLECVRPNGDGYRARCPAHEDFNPSLSIRETSDGTILLKCHAGCSTDAVCDAVGFAMRNLFSMTGNGTNGKASRIVEVYDYVNEQGELLYQNVRYDPKDFRMRRKNGESWIYSLGNTRHVPYNLPEILAAQSILIVEGERDCESARKLGLVATSSKHWRAEFSDFLRAKSVAIISDADEPGRKIASGVAQMLAGKVRSLKVFELPGSGKDLSDWLQNGGTREALLDFIELQPELQEAAIQGAKAVEIYTPAQIMGLSSEAVEYICYGLAPKGMIASVDGPPKTGGKSTIAMMGIDATLNGKLFLNHATSRVPIFFVTEESPRTVRLLLERCGLTNIDGLYILPASRSALTWAQLALEIEKQCAALKIGWLIVDTFHGVAGLEGDAENDAGAVVQALTPLRRISAALDVAVTITRHTRKSGGQIGESGRGSSAFTGFVDTIVEVKRLPGNQSITRRQLEITGRVEQARMEIELRDGLYIIAPDLGVDGSMGEAERLASAIAANPKASKRQLEEQTGIGRNRLEKIAGKSGWLFNESGWERSGS